MDHDVNDTAARPRGAPLYCRGASPHMEESAACPSSPRERVTSTPPSLPRSCWQRWAGPPPSRWRRRTAWRRRAPRTRSGCATCGRSSASRIRAPARTAARLHMSAAGTTRAPTRAPRACTWCRSPAGCRGGSPAPRVPTPTRAGRPTDGSWPSCPTAPARRRSGCSTCRVASRARSPACRSRWAASSGRRMAPAWPSARPSTRTARPSIARPNGSAPSRAIGVAVRRYDRLLYRHWDGWDSGRRVHVFVVEVAGDRPPVDLLRGAALDAPLPPSAARSRSSGRPTAPRSPSPVASAPQVRPGPTTPTST